MRVSIIPTPKIKVSLILAIFVSGCLVVSLYSFDLHSLNWLNTSPSNTAQAPMSGQGVAKFEAQVVGSRDTMSLPVHVCHQGVSISKD